MSTTLSLIVFGAAEGGWQYIQYVTSVFMEHMKTILYCT